MGTTNATGTVLDHVNMQEVMDYTAEKTDYQRKHEEYKHQTATKKRKGIARHRHRGCGLAAESPVFRRHATQ